MSRFHKRRGAPFVFNYSNVFYEKKKRKTERRDEQMEGERQRNRREENQEINLREGKRGEGREPWINVLAANVPVHRQRPWNGELCRLVQPAAGSRQLVSPTLNEPHRLRPNASLRQRSEPGIKQQTWVRRADCSPLPDRKSVV